MRHESGDDADAEFLTDLQHRVLVGDGVDDVAHVVEAQPILRHRRCRSLRWSCASQLADRALEIRQIFLHGVDRGELVLDDDIDNAVRHLDRHRADLFRRVDAEPAALDHRRPAHAEGRALGRDDDVGAGDQRRVAGKATAVDHRDHRHEAGELREGGEGLGIDRDARADVIVAGPAAAALAEQDQRQAEAMRELEDPILLVVVAAALRARQHGVVVVHQRRARARFVEQVAVDRAHAGDDAVGRRVLAQLLHRVALVLPRHDQWPVFVERARIDQPRRCFRAASCSRSCAAGRPPRAGSRPASARDVRCFRVRSSRM